MKIQDLFEKEDISKNDKFKRWFSNSWVTTKQGHGGDPLVVYHRTASKFDVFKPTGASGNAMFFRSDPSKNMSHHNTPPGKEGVIEMPVYLRIINPLLIDDFNRKEMRKRFNGGSEFPWFITDKCRAALKKGNFDGIIHEYDDVDGEVDEFVVLEPNQIKSVNNNGDFNLNDPNIMR